MIYDTPQQFTTLVKLGIGHHADALAGEVNWNEIETLADQQGLSAVVLDGIERLSVSERPPKMLLLQLIGSTLQQYEQRYDQYCKAIAEMAAFYNSHGFKMMVLKGYACGLDWPRPEHRQCGDVDIWMFGHQREADELLRTEKGIKVDNSHHHHTVYSWRGFLVENHYDFINTKDLKSSRQIEQIFKDLGCDDSHFVILKGEKVYVPSPNLHALFLIRHNVAHFVSTSVNMRQILDWAFYVKRHTKEIDWKWLVEVLEQYHMSEFFNTINAICVEDLGFSASIFHSVQFKPDLKERVLNDILYPRFSSEEPRELVKRLVYKYRRWQGNAWKQKMCYGESRSEMFWYGVWGHLLKPKSI